MELLDFAQYLVCTQVACQFHFSMFCMVYLLGFRGSY